MSSQLDKLGVSKNLHVVERAQRLVDVGIEYKKLGLPWKPLLSRHEFEDMVRIPEARALLQRARDLFLGTRKPQQIRVRPVTRKEIPETLIPEEEGYRRKFMHYKYVRDLLLLSKTHKIVVDYHEYFIYDIEDLNKLLRPWFNEQWDRATFFRKGDYSDTKR